MKAIKLLTVLSMIFPVCVMAIEDPACSTPGATFIEHSASELRQIAASCQEPAVARLFYNRAYHKELLAEGKLLSGLINLKEKYEYELTAYRLYIALVEEMASQYYPDVQQRIEVLNKVYEHRGEVVELRLRGNDRLADALERKMLF